MHVYETAIYLTRLSSNSFVRHQHSIVLAISLAFFLTEETLILARFLSSIGPNAFYTVRFQFTAQYS